MTSHRPVPGRLRAPAPGWTTRADVVVVGSGIAGLTAALRIHAANPSLRLLVVTKDVLAAGSTQWAQGGIAAALGPGDTPEQHEHDTLVAGAGACDVEAVRVLVTEGPEAVRELIALGTQFDHHPDGELSLTREGGHHRDRIAHAGGDATGRGDPARADRRGRAGAGDRGRPARAGRRPAPRRRRRRRRPDAARARRGPARRRRGRALPGGRPRLGWPRPGLQPVHQPQRVHRGRDGRRAAGRRAAARPRVRPVPPHRDVARPRLPGPAAADLRGGARRGRLPRRLRRRPLHAGRARARRPRAPRRGRQGDHPPDDRDRPAAHVARRPPPGRRVLGAPLPDHPARLPRARRRPGDRARSRSRPAQHYASGGVATDLWGRTTVPGPLRHRRGRLLRASTAPTGWRPTRCSRGWSSPAASPTCCPASCATGPTPSPTRAPEGLVAG